MKIVNSFNSIKDYLEFFFVYNIIAIIENFQFHQGLSPVLFITSSPFSQYFQFHQGLSRLKKPGIRIADELLSIPSRIIDRITEYEIDEPLDAFNSIKDYR